MLELSFIRENNESIIEHLKVRNKDFKDLILKVLDFDEQRRSAQFKLDNELSELNQLEDTLAYISPVGICFFAQEATKLRNKTITIFKIRSKLCDSFIVKQINNFDQKTKWV